MRKRLLMRWGKPFVLLLPITAMFALLIASLAVSAVQGLGYIPVFGYETLTFDYFAEALSSDIVLGEIGRSIGVSIVATLLTAVIAVMLAWCIVTAFGAKGIINQMSKLPMLMPLSVCCLCVITLAASTGFVPRLLYAMGVEDAQEMFKQVLYWPNSIGVILVLVFHMVSYFTYMVVDVMKQISDTLGEAAENLGASPWSSFRHVVLPYCMPTIKSTAIFVFIACFGNYEVPLLVGSTMAKLLPVHAYMEYSNHQFALHRPEAMALNVIMLVIAILVVVGIHAWDVHDQRKRGIA